MDALPDLIRPRSGLVLGTSCGFWSAAGVRVVLVIRVMAQRRLGPTILANTRWAVGLSPVCLSVQARVVMVPWTKTRSSLASDSATSVARVVKVRSTLARRRSPGGSTGIYTCRMLIGYKEL